MGWELPTDINPPDTLCVQLQVPNDPAYIAAFWGAILDLSAAFNWANDSAHAAKAAAARMRQMYLAAQLLNCQPAPSNKGTGGYLRQQTLFRQNPANLCQLQAQCPDGSWDTIFDASLCNPNPAPGGGVTPPGAGTCQDYKLKFLASATTPLPFSVNTGDTITIVTLQGAGSDGTLDWYCPDGSYFIAGACAGGAHLVSGDPLSTANHMSIILKIGASYYPFISGTFTVPSGVANAPIYILVNDTSLTDNSGTYSLDINYCNNAAPPSGTWCKKLDFTISPQGFVSYSVNDGCGVPTSNSAWSSGSGWTTPTYFPSCAPTTPEAQTTIALDIGATATITSVEIKGHYSGSGTHGRAIQVIITSIPPWSTGSLPINQLAFPTGDFDFSSGAISASGRYIEIDAYDTGTGLGGGATAFLYTSLILKGTGTNPFGSSNC